MSVLVFEFRQYESWDIMYNTLDSILSPVTSMCPAFVMRKPERQKKKKSNCNTEYLLSQLFSKYYGALWKSYKTGLGNCWQRSRSEAGDQLSFCMWEPEVPLMSREDTYGELGYQVWILFGGKIDFSVKAEALEMGEMSKMKGRKWETWPQSSAGSGCGRDGRFRSVEREWLAQSWERNSLEFKGVSLRMLQGNQGR